MNITLEARSLVRQRAANKRLTFVVMCGFVLTLALLGTAFDALTRVVGEIELITVPIAIVLTGSLLHNFVKGMMLRFLDPESSEYEYVRAMDWVVWMGFIIGVWEIFILGQQFFPTKVLLILRDTSPYGLVAGSVLGCATAFSTLQWGAYSVLRSVGVEPADESNECDRKLLNLVRTLSAAAGIVPPDTYILREESPNIFSVGRSPKHASIVATQGLLERLGVEELEGVVAHEISHIRNYDIRLRTAMTALFGSALLVSHATRHVITAGPAPDIRMPKFRGLKKSLLVIFWVTTLFVGPLIGYTVVMLTSRRREYIADISGSALTHNPRALADALDHISRLAEPSALLNRNIAHLCILDPLHRQANHREGFFADLFATHPPTKKRIELLQALALQKQ